MVTLCDRFVAGVSELDKAGQARRPVSTAPVAVCVGGRGVRAVIARQGVPASIVQLGARAELAFTADPPRSGGASAALDDTELEDVLYLYMLNRGVLITPFHNMALMSPTTTAADVDRHTEAVAALTGR